MKLGKLIRNIVRQPSLWVVLVIVAASVAIFWQFYFKGLLPFPGDLLVSFFFPWNGGGFPGYNSWTTHKEYIAADTIRQMYPWKSLAVLYFKHWKFPLWNPYNFSGTPLLANLQSAVFFPTNLLYGFLPLIWGWVLPVVILPLLFALFTYLFLRSLKLSRIAGAFGAVAVMNLSYLWVWQELIVHWQTVVFLPLCLWLVNKYSEERKLPFLLLISLLFAFSAFGGHIQTLVYFAVLLLAYMLFRGISLKDIVVCFVVGGLLSAVQLLPSTELYLQSAREGAATAKLFPATIIPPPYLLTFLTPDFFGNIATNNYWGTDYDNYQAYFGLVTLMLTLLSVSLARVNRTVKFFLVWALIGVLFAATPLAYLLFYSRIPVISSSNASRAIFLTQFSGAVLAAFGLDFWLKAKGRLSLAKLWPLIIPGAVIIFTLIATIVHPTANFRVTRNNLVIPLVIFLLVFSFLTLSGFFRRFLKLFAGGLILIAVVETTYFFNKFQPFTPEKFVFPNHPVFEFLKNQPGENRFFGSGTAYVDTNFATYYRVFAPDGYDSLYVRRYGELIASAVNGRIPEILPRSDARLESGNSFYENRLLDLLGVRFVLDKDDNYKKDWEPDNSKFPPDRYRLVWQLTKWKVYERKTALPRVFLAGNYVVRQGKAILNTLYDPKFNLSNTLILEKDPDRRIFSGSGSARIVHFSPDRVVVETQSDKPKLLFFSDTYFSGWGATVNGVKTPILRADYTFRAVPVGAGRQMVVFTYNPLSFRLGLLVSSLTFLGVLIMIGKTKIAKRP